MVKKQEKKNKKKCRNIIGLYGKIKWIDIEYADCVKHGYKNRQNQYIHKQKIHQQSVLSHNSSCLLL